MNDTAWRFLTAVLERVPEARIVDVRLFPAIRQGGIESGLAVLAVEPPPAVVADDTLLASSTIAVEPGDALGVVGVVADVEVELAHPHADEPELIQVHADAPGPDDALIVDAPSPELAAGGLPVRAEHLDVDVAVDREATWEVASEGVVVEYESLAGYAEVSIPMEAADVVLADAAPIDGEETVALGDLLALPAPERPQEREPESRRRLEILCARYKLLVKGPDRGKWDLEIVHQADAPLDTLEKVIAGVVRRAGEEADPERYSRESLRAALDAPAWARSA
ncbi:MAG: hypothetical protein IT361_14020 [Gemmatimonadaceae bacterium]|nr:hypothetical protein [Gemmatimonadaceae bacterium]